MWDGDGMIVHDAEDRVFADLFANFDPVADCAQIIANVQVASWLNARKNTFHTSSIPFWLEGVV